MAAQWNYTQHVNLEDLKMDSNFMWLLVSLICAVCWVVYNSYYNSRLLGYIMTRLVNRFYFQDENFKIGSMTINALSGKVMFRDLVYLNYDYTVRIQDGYLIFRWWRAYIPKDVSEDLSHSDTRLSVMLNGFELHVYNRCRLYNELEKRFGLDPSIFPEKNDETNATTKENAMNLANERANLNERKVRAEAVMARTWRDLIPVIKLDVCSGRVVFGNRLVPTSLSVSVEEAHLVYSTKPPASKLDYLMHFVKAKAENCRVMLVPSPNYTGMVDDPPRYMGEGFVVMSSNYIELYFYMDEPGLVPDQPVLLQLANGDVVESAPPIWGIDIKCGKGTDFSYGPWADRQREHLFKFFYPADYQNLIVTPQPKPGDRRQMQAFDIRLSTLNEATVDILFSKNKETNAVHVNIGAGSYLEVNLPWIVLQDGYTTKITGQLLHLEATTSLQYRSLAESETLEFAVKCHYPLIWNQHQSWSINFTGCKATANLVYSHKGFFQDLLNDWSSKARPDILHFVPYTWKISLLLKDFELITISNQYNWIDCSSTNQENTHVAFCGDLFDLSFDLPFEDFLPTIVPLKIWIQGEGVDMCLYLPEINTSRVILLALEKNMHLRIDRPKSTKWRKKCLSSLGWINCWSVPIVAISIKYSYHPIAPLGPDPQADITTPEKEEILLSPMRIARSRKQPHVQWNNEGKNKFDPSTMTPDVVSVELEIGPSVILVFGSIIRNFINLKENIFGEDQAFTDMQKNVTMDLSDLGIKPSEKQAGNSSAITPVSGEDSSDNVKVMFDPRTYRPLEVTVSVTLHDIQGYLAKNCGDDDHTCPLILIERFGFEMKKGYKETKLQLLISPSMLVISDNPGSHQTVTGAHLNQGHMLLSSLQVRGHAMFSDEDRSLDDETVEYSWLLEVQLGQLTGRLTISQLFYLVSSLETFVLLASDAENTLSPPKSTKMCHHGGNSISCVHTNVQTKYHCPTSEDIKYRMSRVAIDMIDIYIAESGTALQTWMSPIRLCLCNLHGDRFGNGITGLVPHVKFTQYIQANTQTFTQQNRTGTNTYNHKHKSSDVDSWIEVGNVSLGPVLLEAATSLPTVEIGVQHKFLKLHDEKSKRLWFLWPTEECSSKNVQCGCLGGCSFFGSNRNGRKFLKPNRADIEDGINVAVFNIQDAKSGEYGYGQSLLHEGQLIFHTPPYSGLEVCLQGSPQLSVTSPSPQPSTHQPQFNSSSQRNSLTRRFSYTSVYKGSNTAPVSNNKPQVPYARLIDSEGVGNPKLDSDSKLNKTILSVPQMESSMSDSKLALNYFNKQETGSQPCPTAKRINQHVTQSAKESVANQKKMVNISESHYSLNSHIGDEQDSKEVQRTVSMNSTNQSEIFFSAEEEISTSRSSSLRHSRDSKFGDNSQHRTLSTSGTSGDQHPSKKYSIPSLADSFHTATQKNSLHSDYAPIDSDDSRSFSSTSFISALSSQEDMTLINLHAQANKPICESPLLMASYVCHLTHFKCKNWSQCSLPKGTDAFSISLFKSGENGKLIYAGNKFTPIFQKKMENVGVRVIPRQENLSQPGDAGTFSNMNSQFKVQGKIHPYSQTWWELLQGAPEEREHNTEGIVEELSKTKADSCSVIVLKFRGAVDIMISPLLLESMQRFVETLTPLMATVHPLAILNHLHFSCARTVEAANILKHEQNLANWIQHTNGRKDKLTDGKSDENSQVNIYEQNISTQLNFNVFLPKVNVILLQSSIVEDMITFSALDNVQDLTCASLFAIYIENVNFKYTCNEQMLDEVRVHYRPTLRVLNHKKTFRIIKASKAFTSAHSDNSAIHQDKKEAEYLETSQKSGEDVNIILDIGKVHAQLRRLHNAGSLIKDAIITSIPTHQSKVSFKCIKIPESFLNDDCFEKTLDSRSKKDEESPREEIGYIMFECGLEGTSIKVTKHLHFNKVDPGSDDKMTSKTDSDICYADSLPSEECKTEKPIKLPRTSVIDEIFKKKDSTSSKPSTPNLGCTNPDTNNPDVDLTADTCANAVIPAKETEKASTCVIDLKTVWFNFAAPPRSPITKKIDYTRLDWNLLTTASPAINAWMNPCNRLGIKVVALYRAYYRRVTATCASLMAATLDVPQIHMPIKSRYCRQTHLARALREDPSLQLCAVLLRYLCQADIAAIQADLAEKHLPSLSTLRRGVIVLSKHWQNFLFAPLLLEHNYKSKIKPLNVTFTLPDLVEDSGEDFIELEEGEVMDESSNLLNSDFPGNGGKLNIPVNMAVASMSPLGPSFASTSPPSVSRGPPPPSSRCSAVFTAPPLRHRNFSEDNLTGYDVLKDDALIIGSNPSIYSSDSHDNSKCDNKAKEDLYSWMVKQDPLSNLPNVKSNEKSNSDESNSGSTLQNVSGQTGYYQCTVQDSLTLLNEHSMFKPFLSSLGLASHQVSQGAKTISSLDSLGSNLSLVAWMDTFRIDIVVSEFGKSEKKKNTKSNKGKSGASNYTDISTEMPSFLCEKVGLDIDLKKIANMTVDDLMQRQNVLYISRGQLKKHINTKINFSISVRYISQQVNMPLLRLLHQISNMYQNVKDTQSELRGHAKTPRQHRKHRSMGAHENIVQKEDASSSLPPLSSQTVSAEPVASSTNSQKVQTIGRSRPQSFAQKLRSTGKSVKGKLGYSFLNEGAHTPMVVDSGTPLHASVIENNTAIAVIPESGKDDLTSIVITAQGTMTPQCWQTLYNMINLYAKLPESKTITHRFSISGDVPDAYKKPSTPRPHSKEHPNPTNGLGLVINGVVRIHRTRLLASLSGLKLEAEMTSLQVSLNASKTPWSLACHLGRTMIVLLEGVLPNQQTVVRVTVGKSQALYSSDYRKEKINSGFLSIGAIRMDLPQHPVALHGMMTRSSKQLSSTLQELGVTRTSSRTSRQQTEDLPESPERPPPPPPRPPPPKHSASAPVAVSGAHASRHTLMQPLLMQFSIALQSLSVTAALLPSLQAQYKMDNVHSTGVTGSKAHFTVDLPQHSLSFVTKLQASEANLPSAASIALPAVHVSAQYVADNVGFKGHIGHVNQGTDSPMEGIVLRRGSYLSATADIGKFEHSLSTDLLNHLVFVQKVFMKEVNEVVQKVYGGEKPVPLWSDEDDMSALSNRLLFSLVIRIERIQLTATTPSNSAVRLETGIVEFQLSNRFENVSQPTTLYNMKLFAKAQVDINLSLGQLIKNAMFEEAEPEFQQFAFFNTRIALRNAFQDEMVSGDDKEVVLITLKRPLIYVQPMAIDKAILVWLNYKNAYEYWNEKRANLNKEVLKATMQVFEKVQFSSQLSTLPHLSTLFLQLTVDDMGICLPLNQLPLSNWGQRSMYDLESRGAVVVTLESTSISACSSGSLVSKGRFVGLCLRFAEDFETSLDDWKPDTGDASIMNLCSVSEGTYEVCSRTIAAKQNSENAKWFLNVSWQMEGVDIHLDVNVGKQLSALGHTLTMLTGSEEEDPLRTDYGSDEFDDTAVSRDSQDSIVHRTSRKWSDNLPAFVFDASIDAKKRSKLIEKEMNEQAKIINDLQMLGATHGTIKQEMKKLRELEALVFKDFRRDMIQKLRRQSVKASSITKEKLGLGSNRSRSFVIPSPTPEDRADVESCDSTIVASISSSKGGGGSEETLIPKTDTENNLSMMEAAEVLEDAGWSSVENSPHPGPSRTASLRDRSGHRRIVTFNPAITRQSSLPSGGTAMAMVPDGVGMQSADSWGSRMDVQGETVQLRKKNNIQSMPQLMDGSSGGSSKKPQEPNIDFELDVKVLINSGKCVLHTKDPAKEKDEDSKINQPKIRKERSASGGLVELGAQQQQPQSCTPSSPSMSRKHGKQNQSQHSGGHSAHQAYHSQSHHSRNQYHLIDLTIFHVPGLDFKVHYESKTVQDDVTTPQVPLKTNQTQTRKAGIKKASLFAWVTLQSIPEETIISPHILEFLEQTLEPIPTKASLSSAGDAVNAMFATDKDDTGVAASYGQYVYASFPVDVIVYFHMQPSTFRFSCLPVSRVECMLQLPSLGIVFSSKRAQEDEMSHPGVAMGGLSVTGCLADFSVYIFHPYGGKKPGIKEAQWSPLSDSERKDSLSINVEFVKFHLSRSRKLDFQADPDQSTAVVRFSTILDIGSASFKYDMRRLTEILAFPKAWYRRTIVRRLFLGDISLSAPSESDASGQPRSTMSPVAVHKRQNVVYPKLKDSGREDSEETAQSNSTESPAAAWETLVLFAFNFTKLNVHMNMGNVMGNVTWLSRDFHSMGRLNIGSTGHRNMCIGVGLGSSSLDAKGGIVGGIISLSTIDTFVHIIEEPGSNPSHHCGLSLNALELRLDYMGTSMLMARVSSLSVELKDEWMAHIMQTHPHHKSSNRPAIILVHGTLNWQQLQLLISRSTTPDLFKMQMKLEEFFTQQFKSSKRVFSNLYTSYTSNTSAPIKSGKHRKEDITEHRQHRHWQKVLSLISGLQLSTLTSPLPTNGTVLGGTMELQGAHISLGCFHGINFKSKSWALFSLKDTFISFATEAQQVPTESGEIEVHIVQSLTASLGASSGTAVQHESMATVCRMSRNMIFPPQFKTLREWFHYAFFNSDIDAVECFPSLERDGGSLERDREKDRERPQRATATSATKLIDPHHTREVIFSLPSLQLHLKTQHLQQARLPNNPEEKCVVECNFITEFEDHIFVTVDAEAFFFLHDLISSYIKEKVRTAPVANAGRSQSPDAGSLPSTSSTGATPKSSDGEPSSQCSSKTSDAALPNSKNTVRINVYDKDWRVYHCKTWHLEPTVRLLSWAGKSIEPYGVDYILQKLGFSHARTTIPKWLQRGSLDPLDKLLALILLQLVSIIPRKQT